MRIRALMEALLERQITGKYLGTAAISYGKCATSFRYWLAGFGTAVTAAPFPGLWLEAASRFLTVAVAARLKPSRTFNIERCISDSNPHPVLLFA